MRRTGAQRNTVWACRALLYAALQFVALTVAAMWAYPGGNASDPAAVGYRFLDNFFSDLGQTWVLYGGLHTPNATSSALFIVAMATVGVALAWAAWPIGRAVSGGRGGVVAFAVGAWGTVAGVAFVAVAAIPWNLALGPHMYAVKTAFLALLVFMALVVVEQARNGWPAWNLAIGVVYTLALGAYFADLMWGPSITTPGGAHIQAVAQKVIVYLSIGGLGALAWAVLQRQRAQRAAAV